MSAAIGSRHEPSGGDLLRLYRAVRAYTEALAVPLSAEDCAIQSMPDASPTKWHLAHTSWFFETLILGADKDYAAFDPRFGFLFNSYYEALGPRHARPQRGLVTRPSLDDVMAYRRHIDAAMDLLLSRDVQDRLAVQIRLGLHHEQQHQELILTDIKHAFFCNPLLPAYRRAKKTDGENQMPATGPAWQTHAGGLVEIGHQGADFAFDNETPRHKVYLHPFRIAATPVTNGEYLAFIADGGYRRPEFWLSDGWSRVQQEGWDAPLYWLSDDDGRRSIFTLEGPAPLDAAAPLEHVSFFEAAAFAAWAGKRLPTEFEWEAASSGFDHGRVWEWTRSSYDPYPGFKPFEGVAAEYNGKFMVGQLVLRGGSHATPPGHARISYRNFFPPAARWQFSGVRLAEDA
jgi:ergothioneine biosynthesis protein EgtB